MSQASGSPDTPQRNRNNSPVLMRAMQSICKNWKDLQLNDNKKEVGEILRG